MVIATGHEEEDVAVLDEGEELVVGCGVFADRSGEVEFGEELEGDWAEVAALVWGEGVVAEHGGGAAGDEAVDGGGVVVGH